MAPARLVGPTLDQPPAPHGIPDADRMRVACRHEFDMRADEGHAVPLPLNPRLPGQQDGAHQALCVAQRNVDQQAADVLARDGFEVLGVAFQVPVGFARRGVHEPPHLLGNLVQAAFGDVDLFLGISLGASST